MPIKVMDKKMAELLRWTEAMWMYHSAVEMETQTRSTKIYHAGMVKMLEELQQKIMTLGVFVDVESSIRADWEARGSNYSQRN